MAYPSPTGINATKGFGEVLIYVNQVTEFWLGRMLMIAIFTIFSVGFYKARDGGDILSALSLGSFITLIIGLIFFVIGFLDPVTFGIIVGLTIIFALVLLADNN